MSVGKITSSGAKGGNNTETSLLAGLQLAGGAGRAEKNGESSVSVHSWQITPEQRVTDCSKTRKEWSPKNVQVPRSNSGG